MHPAVPIGRDLRSLGVALVDHVAAPAAVVAVLVGAGLEIAIAELVLADEVAGLFDGEPSADGCAVPPGEDRFQHRNTAFEPRDSAGSAQP